MSKFNKGLSLIIGILSILFLYTRNSILEPIVFFILAILLISMLIERVKNKDFLLSGIYIFSLLIIFYIFLQTLTFL